VLPKVGSVRVSVGAYLVVAERSLWSAFGRALGSDQARRLELLARRAGEERELVAAFTPDLPARPDVPEDATIGWYLRNDPHVRAVRRARGLSVPAVPS
jgi:hypothetical protein